MSGVPAKCGSGEQVAAGLDTNRSTRKRFNGLESHPLSTLVAGSGCAEVPNMVLYAQKISRGSFYHEHCILGQGTMDNTLDNTVGTFWDNIRIDYTPQGMAIVIK